MTKTELKSMADAYKEAELSILEGQKVSMNGRTLDRADLDEVRKGRREFERRLAKIGTSKHSRANFG